MHTEHDVKINGGGDSAVNRIETENKVFCDIIGLPKEDQWKLLGKYFEKYGVGGTA